MAENSTGRSMTARRVWRIDLPTKRRPQALADDIASFVGADDLVTLSGDLGAGKTTFARALIRWLVGRSRHWKSPSPTFTLMQVYERRRFPIVHADLYRIERPGRTGRTRLGRSGGRARWCSSNGPSAPASALTGDRLDIALFTDTRRGPDYRRAEITGHGALGATPVAHARGAECSGAVRLGRGRAPAFMQGDASTRAYERAGQAGRRKSRVDDFAAASGRAAVRNGKPYSAIAHLAENIRPSSRSTRHCARKAFRRRRFMPPTSRRASPCSNISAREGIVDDDGPIRGTLRAGGGAAGHPARPRPAARTCRSTAGPIASRPMISKRLLIEAEFWSTGMRRISSACSSPRAPGRNL